VEAVDDPSLGDWIERFEVDKGEAAVGFWYDIHKGIQESLKES
jgi:glyceraldehyde-3-phosphate dehydrogenase (ferredoxin)